MMAIFEPLVWGMSAFAILSSLLGGILAAMGTILRRSSAYWSRQIMRVDSGMEAEPEPWYVRLTIRMHRSRLLRRLLG